MTPLGTFDKSGSKSHFDTPMSTGFSTPVLKGNTWDPRILCPLLWWCVPGSRLEVLPWKIASPRALRASFCLSHPRGLCQEVFYGKIVVEM